MHGTASRWKALALGVLWICLPTSTQAAFTPVWPSFSYDWAKTALDRIYFDGADVFTPSNPPQQAQSVYTGRGITATRMDDFGIGGPLSVVGSAPGQVDDQVWTGGPFKATVKFRRASLHTALLYAASPGGQPAQLLSDVVGTTATVLDPPAQWIWELGVYDTSGNPPFWRERWSQSNLNVEPNFAPGLDYLITYRVDGLADGQSRWLLFWGDGTAALHISDGWYSSIDYDDLVVELTPIPEPATVLMLALGVISALSSRRSSGMPRRAN
jgi:hypothetical protein